MTIRKRMSDQPYFSSTLCVVVDRSLSPRVFHVFLCWPQKCGHQFDILDHRNQTDDCKKYCCTAELCCRWFKQGTVGCVVSCVDSISRQHNRLRYHRWTNWVRQIIDCVSCLTHILGVQQAEPLQMKSLCVHPLEREMQPAVRSCCRPRARYTLVSRVIKRAYKILVEGNNLLT